MFEDFLYLLRRYGLKVSLTEWMTLMEALDKGLHNSSFTGFYYLCRCLLVKSEADFDRFDRAFLEYFKNVPFQQEVSQELLDWLNRPDTLLDHANWDEEQALKNMGLSEEEIERMLKERMEEQIFDLSGVCPEKPDIRILPGDFFRLRMIDRTDCQLKAVFA